MTSIEPIDGVERFILDDVRVIDGSGSAPETGLSIVVADGVFEYVGPPTDGTRAWTGLRLAGEGRTVVPGLFDLHIHSTLASDMRCYIRNGVTTVRFAGVDLASVSDLRERSAEAGRPVPGILNLGPMIDREPVSWPQWARVVVGSDDARGLAVELLDGEGLNGLFAVQGVSREILRVLVEVAHERGRPVAGQFWQVDGLECAELGVDQVDNTSRIFVTNALSLKSLLEPMPVPRRLALLARAWADIDWDLTMPLVESMVDHGVAYCPTFVVADYLCGIGREELERDRDYAEMFDEADHSVFARLANQMDTDWTPEDAEYWRMSLDNKAEWVRRFHTLGGIVLPGTDMQYGGIQLHRELINLEACGLSKREVIAAATGRAAQAAGVSGTLGFIEQGKTADFLVLGSDPLDDLANLRDIELVVQNGIRLADVVS